MMQALPAFQTHSGVGGGPPGSGEPMSCVPPYWAARFEGTLCWLPWLPCTVWEGQSRPLHMMPCRRQASRGGGDGGRCR
jgi:hypothetical protein